MTPAQARAARALLKLGVRDVGELAGVTPNTVSRIEQDEAGVRGPQSSTVAAIQRAYEAAGVIFIAENSEGPGVRLRKRIGDLKNVRHEDPEPLPGDEVE